MLCTHVGVAEFIQVLQETKAVTLDFMTFISVHIAISC